MLPPAPLVVLLLAGPPPVDVPELALEEDLEPVLVDEAWVVDAAWLVDAACVVDEAVEAPPVPVEALDDPVEGPWLVPAPVVAVARPELAEVCPPPFEALDVEGAPPPPVPSG